MFEELIQKKEIGEVKKKEGSDFAEEVKSETAVNEIGGLEKMKPFPLDAHTEEVIREHFEKRGFEILEITDAYVKVKSSGGKTMTIENEVAAKYFASQ